MRYLETLIVIEKVEEIIVNIARKYEEFINEDLIKLKNMTLQSTICLDWDNEVNAKVSEDKNGNRRLSINLGFFRELEGFYKTVFSRENEDFYKLVASEDKYNEEKVEVYIDYMMTISLSVFILHEFGHIYNGHLLYMIDKGKEVSAEVNTNDENYCSEEEGIKAITHQAMEWNADDFAATRIISVLADDENINNLNQGNKNYIKSKEHMLFLIIFSSYIAFSLMGIGQKRKTKIKDFKDYKHLPKRYRVKRLIRNEIGIYNLFNSEKVNIDFGTLLQVEEAMERWVNTYKRDIEGRPEGEWSSKNNLEELDDEHLRYYDFVEKYLIEELPQELKQYERLQSSANS